MDEKEFQVAISRNDNGNNKFYVVIVGSKSEDGRSRYIKRDGKIDNWKGPHDYMESYQECLDAININYTILKEVETPYGYKGSIAHKDTNM